MSTTESIGATHVKTCKRYFREFEESEVDVVDVSPATDVDSGFRRNDRGEMNIGVENIADLCSQCREKLGVMDLLGFGCRNCWMFYNQEQKNKESALFGKEV